MDNKISVLLAVLMLLLVPMPALAYDQATPYTTTVNYVVASVTTFTVTSVETAMNFNSARDTLNVVASGTSGGTVAWGTITNTGNVRQGFKVKVTSANPTGITLRISNSADMSGAVTVSTTLASPTGWEDIAAGSGLAYIHPRADFGTNAADGSVSRTLSVESGPPTPPPPPPPPDEGP